MSMTTIDIATDLSAAGVPDKFDAQQLSAQRAKTPPDRSDMTLLGVPIGHLSSNVQLALVGGAVLIVYQVWAYMQESLVRAEGFKGALFIAGNKFTIGALLASIDVLCKEKRLCRRAPAKWYLAVGIIGVGASGLTMIALNHVSYPTMVVFKSAKVIPVMLAGSIVLRKRFPLSEYLAAMAFILGLSMFTLGDTVAAGGHNDNFGIVCLVLALCSDAFLGNIQEKTMREYRVPQSELVMYSYVVSAGICLAVTAATGELLESLSAVRAQPSLYGEILMMGVTAYVGLVVVLTMVRYYGAVTCVVVTSCRKVFTIFFSFLFFPKPFTSLYALGTLTIICGTFLHVYTKHPAEVRHAVLTALNLRLRLRTASPSPLDPLKAALAKPDSDQTVRMYMRRSPLPLSRKPSFTTNPQQDQSARETV